MFSISVSGAQLCINLVKLTDRGRGGVTGEGRLRAGDWLGRCGGDCCGCPEVEEQVDPGEGTEVCCWLGGVM